jgi:DNA polymerase-4
VTGSGSRTPGARSASPLPLARLWGVGPKTRDVLEGWGLRTIGDLARADPALVEGHFGAHGVSILERAQGIDDDLVTPHEAAKSVGHEHTFDRDTLDQAQIERTLLQLAEGVGKRLRAASVRAPRSVKHTTSTPRACLGTTARCRTPCASGRHGRTKGASHGPTPA